MSEWIVVQDYYGFSVLELVKRTEKQVVGKAENRATQNRHIPLSQVMAFLPKDRAKAMVDRLVSSQALEREDRIKATQRHADRVERIKAEFAPS